MSNLWAKNQQAIARSNYKMMSEQKKKYTHLDLIQGIINRLSSNSFLLKGWTVVLVSALIAMSSHIGYGFFAIIPVIIFWGLDGFLLWQEKLYRNLYNHVRILKDEDVDFSMDTANIYNPKKSASWINATFSKTLIPFYGVLIFAIIVWS